MKRILLIIVALFTICIGVSPVHATLWSYDLLFTTCSPESIGNDDRCNQGDETLLTGTASLDFYETEIEVGFGVSYDMPYYSIDFPESTFEGSGLLGEDYGSYDPYVLFDDWYASNSVDDIFNNHIVDFDMYITSPKSDFTIFSDMFVDIESFYGVEYGLQAVSFSNGRPVSVPEPSTLWFMVTSFLGLIGFRKYFVK